MSPKEARVFVIEDDEFYQDVIRRALEGAGHKVVLTSDELFDAIAKIREGQVGNMGIQVATIDANLTRWGGEGQLIAEEIHKRTPHVKTVGLSHSGEVYGVDVNVSKRDMGKLGEVVDSL